MVCCHTELSSRLRAREGAGGNGGSAARELSPVSPMHPSMWRKWLMMHDTNRDVRGGIGGGEGGVGDSGGGGREVRGESFSGSEDPYTVGPFDYCKNRCRSNSAVTKNENEFQDARHHCFGDAYVEKVGAADTLSPGQEKLHDQNSDFKLQGGVSVELGLVPTMNPRSQGAGNRRHFNAASDNAASAGGGGSGGGDGARDVAHYAGDILRTTGFTSYAGRLGKSQCR